MRRRRRGRAKEIDPRIMVCQLSLRAKEKARPGCGGHLLPPIVCSAKGDAMLSREGFLVPSRHSDFRLEKEKAHI